MNTRLPLAVGALLAALTLAGCSSPGTPADKTPTSSASKPPATPKAEVQTPPADKPAATAPTQKPTCETMISQGTVDALKSQGWTFERREFQIGDVLIDGGLECLWADYSTASDHGQMYAWGPLSADRSRAAQASLQADGWLRSSEDGITYITEDPAYAIAKDDDGFGMTYEFGDGWVKFADTKQGLLLIDWGE